LKDDRFVHKYAVWDYAPSSYWRFGIVALSDDSTVPPRTIMNPEVCAVFDDDTGFCEAGHNADEIKYLGPLPLYTSHRNGAMLDLAVPKGRKLKWILVAPTYTKPTSDRPGSTVGDYWLDIDYLGAVDWNGCVKPTPDVELQCTDPGE
jgi:hypothetical protein